MVDNTFPSNANGRHTAVLPLPLTQPFWDNVELPNHSAFVQRQGDVAVWPNPATKRSGLNPWLPICLRWEILESVFMSNSRA